MPKLPRTCKRNRMSSVQCQDLERTLRRYDFGHQSGSKYNQQDPKLQTILQANHFNLSTSHGCNGDKQIASHFNLSTTCGRNGEKHNN